VASQRTPSETSRARARTLLVVLRRPERQVIAQELHDERRVLVRLLVEGVELSDSAVKRLLRQLARFRLLAPHLVQEDGIVERQAQTDGVRRREAFRFCRRVVVRGLISV